MPFDPLADILQLTRSGGRLSVPPLPFPGNPQPLPGPGYPSPPPFEPLSIPPPPEPLVLPEPVPDEPGWLETIGDVLDRPGNAFRGLLTGRADPLLGLIPFSESLGLYDPKKNRVSGQDVNEKFFGIDKTDNILSGSGAAGIGTELLLDPLNLLPGFLGVKALTKGGKAAKVVGGHLDDAARVGQKALRERKALQAQRAAAETAGNLDEIAKFDDLLSKPAMAGNELFPELLRDGAQIPDAELMAQLAGRQDELGAAAREVLEIQKARGLGDEALRYLPDAGERVKAGQEALLSVGGEVDPLGLFRLGGKVNPVNWLPEIPYLTKPLDLPQKTLIEGADAAQGIQDIGRGIAKLPGIKQVGDLFKKTPGVPDDVARGIAEMEDEAQRAATGGAALALERGREFDAVLADLEKQGLRVDKAGEIVPIEQAARIDPLRDIAPPPPKPDEVDLWPTITKEEAAKRYEDWRGQRLADEWTLTPLRKMREEMDVAADVQTGAKRPDLPEKFGGVPGIGRLEKLPSAADLVEPSLDDFQKLEVGKAAQFWNKDAMGGAPGKRQLLTGKVVAFNSSSDTWTVATKSGDQYIIPASKAKRAPYAVRQDYAEAMKRHKAALKKQELLGLEPELRGPTLETAGETRQAFADARNIPLGESMDANAEAFKRRAKDMDPLGLKAGSAVDEAQALPQALEQMLPRLEPGVLPDYKTIEFVSGEELGIGDSLTIGGKAHSVTGTTDGMLTLVDDAGREVRYPFDTVPKDKGVSVLRAEQAPDIDAPLFGKDVQTSANVPEIPESSAVKEALTTPPAKLEQARGALDKTAEKLGLDPDPLKIKPKNSKAALGPDGAFTLKRQGGEEFSVRPVAAEKLLATERHLKTLGERLGIELHFTGDTLPGGANGIYHTAGPGDRGRVLLRAGLNAADAAHVFGHEITHQAVKSLKEQAPVFLSAAKKVLGGTADDLIRKIEMRYAASGFELTDADLVEEIVAEVGGKLFKDDGIKWMSAAAEIDPSITAKIVAHIEDVIQKITTFIKDLAAGPERKQLEAMVERLHKVQFGLNAPNEAMGAAISADIASAKPSAIKGTRLNYILGDAAPQKASVLDLMPERRTAASVQPKLQASLGDEASAARADGMEGQARRARIAEMTQQVKDFAARGKTAPKSLLDNLRQLKEVEATAASEAAKGKYVAGAGEQTKAAAEGGAALNAEVLPDVRQRITDLVEHGGVAAPEAQKIVDEVKAKFQKMLELEQAAGLDTPTFKTRRTDLQYTPHVSTELGHKVLKRVGKSPREQEKLFQALENKRQSLGLEPNPDALKTGQEQHAQLIGMQPRGQQEWLGKRYGAKAAAAFLQLSDEGRKFIFENGLMEDFKQFADEVSTTHGSQIPRLAAFRDLGVSEINQVFKDTLNIPGPVFNENPAAQLFTREARHVKVMAAKDFFDKAGEKFGEPIGKLMDNPLGDPKRPGLEVFKTPLGDRWGVQDLNRQRRKAGLPPFGFDDPMVAQAMLDTAGRLANEDEVHPLLQVYDNITRYMKSTVTRAFPAFHVRNHVGNMIQSWIGGVPVAGPHREAANAVLAGKPVSLTLGDGLKVDRDALLKEANGVGVLGGGHYEQLAEEALDSTKKPTINPLDPDNVFIKGGERVGAAIAGGPGRLLAGGSLKGMDGKIVENTDRLAHYIHMRQKGLSPTDAARHVDQYLFDYSKKNMSEFEKQGLNRLVFFYGYTRNVIPMILGAALNDTRRLKPLTQLAVQPGQPDFQPEYMEDGIVLPTGKDAEGNSKAIYTLGTPLEAAVEPLAKNPLTSLNPIVKGPLELFSGQDFFMERPIEELTKAPHWAAKLPDPLKDLLGVVETTRKRKDGTTYTKTEMNADALWALRSSPASRLSNTLSRASDERKDPLDILANLVTGSRTVSVDDEEERDRAQKEAIKAKLRELEREGRVKGNRFKIENFSRAGEKGLDPLADMLLAALRG